MNRRKRQPGRAHKAGPHFAPAAAAGDDGTFRVPPSYSMPKRVFVICHYCGYTPDGDVPHSGCCPKCGRFSWERFALAEPLVPKHMR